VGLYTEVFYAIIPTLFPYFLPFCYPYILLHFNVHVCVILFSSRHMVELKFAITEQQKSVLTGTAADFLGWCHSCPWHMDNWLRYYTCNIGWRITDPGICSRTESTILWM